MKIRWLHHGRSQKYILLLALFLSYIPVLAQDVYEAWVARYNGPGNSYDVAYALAVDDSGNVYVTGRSAGSFTYSDYATIKYSPAGDTLWVRRYNGPGNGHDEANALAVDGSGNVYVTGIADNYFDYGCYCYVGDYATIKYSSSGDTLWVRRYNGPGNNDDEANALAVDGSGNVYVTGESWGSGTIYDYATIKYSPSGDTVWVRRYNGPGNDNDGAVALAVDGSGNVYVTGSSGTIKYSANGDSLWFGVYGGHDLAIDGSGSVYVAGSSGTSKYSANGDSIWFGVYGGNDLAIDGSGSVYVTGNSYDSVTTHFDYATIKYSSSGDTLWVRRYNGPGNGSDYADALAVDDSGNVYVTGWSLGTVWPDNDYTTIKYSPCVIKAGDANGDGQILLSDIVRIINYLFKDEPLLNPLCRTDTNANGIVTFPDIIYLVNFLFKSGPAPVKSGVCCF